MKRFHLFVRDLRLRKEMTLRDFCRQVEIDPSNWSKVERGIADNPRKRVELDRIADVLSLTKEQKNELIDLAIVASIPNDLSSESILDKLPLFLRTIRGEKPTQSELQQLLKLLKNYTP